jgi:hypothetical protein
VLRIWTFLVGFRTFDQIQIRTYGTGSESYATKFTYGFSRYSVRSLIRIKNLYIVTYFFKFSWLANSKVLYMVKKIIPDNFHEIVRVQNYSALFCYAKNPKIKINSFVEHTRHTRLIGECFSTTSILIHDMMYRYYLTSVQFLRNHLSLSALKVYIIL